MATQIKADFVALHHAVKLANKKHLCFTHISHFLVTVTVFCKWLRFNQQALVCLACKRRECTSTSTIACRMVPWEPNERQLIYAPYGIYVSHRRGIHSAILSHATSRMR